LAHNLVYFIREKVLRMVERGSCRWKKAFYQLLQAGLWEREVAENSIFPLQDEEWVSVCKESERQTVQGLLYRGIQHLPVSLAPPRECILRLMAQAAALEATYQRLTEVTEQIRSLLREANVEPMLIKGQSVAKYYAYPALRVNGDIDWYMPEEMHFGELPAFLREKGFTPLIVADGSICFNYEDVDVELHSQLVDIFRPKSQRLLHNLIAEESAESPLLTLLLIATHILKHVCSVGLGWRQCCDMARAYHTLRDTYDTDKLRIFYKALGLSRWADLLHDLLVNYLDMPTEDLPFPLGKQDKEAHRLAANIERWGNFGQHTAEWEKSKLHTVKQIMARLSFSMRYAPVETTYRIRQLICGQKINEKQYE